MKKPPIRWSEEYTVGIDIIDHQHKKFLDIFNKFQDTIDHKDAFGVMSKQHQLNLYRFVFRIRDYALYHFRTEESFMIRWRYDDFNKHKKDHNDIIRNILDIEEQIFSGATAMSVKAQELIKRWWVHHILTVDKKMVAAVNTHLSPQALVETAKDMLLSGMFEEAILVLTDVLSKDLQQSHAVYLRALAYNSSGNYPQALSDFKTAASMGEKNAMEYLAKRGLITKPQ